jgi:hypothetical protein
MSESAAALVPRRLASDSDLLAKGEQKSSSAAALRPITDDAYLN